MPAFIDRTGVTFEGITVIKELGASKILGRCIYCKSENVYWKNSVVAGHHKSCGCVDNSGLKNTVGVVVDNYKIVEELGGGFVKAKCLSCNNIDVYNKYQLMDNNVLCKNKDCIKSKRVALKNLIGTTHGILEVIQELGNSRVLARCNTCKQVNEYNKQNLKNCSARCKNTDCIEHNRVYNVNGESHLRLKSRVGVAYKGLKIVEDKGGHTVKAQCMRCGETYDYNRQVIIKDGTRCKNPDCGNKRVTPFINTVNNTFGQFTVVEDNGNKVVKAKCNLCGAENNYGKPHIKDNSASCKNCGVNDKNSSTFNKIKGHIINNIKVIQYDYRGRNGELYYSCVCLKCGKGLLLSYNEIFTYQCNKNVDK